MVTPRTGRPRGRPPKPKIVKPARSRGRPPLPLSRDPERYYLALLSAHIEIGRLSGVSEGLVLTTFAGFAFGRPVQTPENLSNMERTGNYYVGMSGWLRGGESGAWRGRNSFRPLADNWRRKLSRIRTKPKGNPDKRWLQAMTLAWCPCLCGEQEDEGRAAYFAASAGEKEYFEATMRPIMNERWAQREAGVKRAEVSPEFMIHLIRTTATDGCAK
jgi:hypothetical protein